MRRIKPALGHVSQNSPFLRAEQELCSEGRMDVRVRPWGKPPPAMARSPPSISITRSSITAVMSTEDLRGFASYALCGRPNGAQRSMADGAVIAAGRNAHLGLSSALAGFAPSSAAAATANSGDQTGRKGAMAAHSCGHGGETRSNSPLVTQTQ